MRSAKSTDFKSTFEALQKSTGTSKDGISSAMRELSTVGSILSSSTISPHQVSALRIILTSTISVLYIEFPLQTLRVSSAILHTAYNKHIRPSSNTGKSKKKRDIIREWENITDSLFQGILLYLDGTKFDATDVGMALYRVFCTILWSAILDDMPTLWVKQLCNILADAAAGCKENIEMLRLPSVLGGHKLGFLISSARDYLTLEALLELLVNVLPSEKALRDRGKFLDVLQHGMSVPAHIKQEISRLLETPSLTKSWDKVTAGIFDALAKSDISYPQPIPVQKFTTCGRTYSQIPPWDRVYIDRHCLLANIPDQDLALDTFQLSFTTIQVVHTATNSKSNCCTVTITVDRAPQLGGQSLLKSPASEYEQKMTFDIPASYLHLLKTALSAREMSELMQSESNNRLSMSPAVTCEQISNHSSIRRPDHSNKTADEEPIPAESSIADILQEITIPIHEADEEKHEVELSDEVQEEDCNESSRPCLPIKPSKIPSSEESQISSPSQSECSSLTTLSELQAKPPAEEPEEEPETLRLGKRKLPLASEQNSASLAKKKKETASKKVPTIEAASSDHIDQPDTKKIRLTAKVTSLVQPPPAIGSQIVKRQPLKVKMKYGGKRRGSSSPSSSKPNALQFDIIPSSEDRQKQKKDEEVTKKKQRAKQQDKSVKATPSVAQTFTFKYPAKLEKTEIRTIEIPVDTVTTVLSISDDSPQPKKKPAVDSGRLKIKSQPTVTRSKENITSPLSRDHPFTSRRAPVIGRGTGSSVLQTSHNKIEENEVPAPPIQDSPASSRRTLHHDTQNSFNPDNAPVDLTDDVNVVQVETFSSDSILDETASSEQTKITDMRPESAGTGLSKILPSRSIPITVPQKPARLPTLPLSGGERKLKHAILPQSLNRGLLPKRHAPPEEIKVPEGLKMIDLTKDDSDNDTAHHQANTLARLRAPTPSVRSSALRNSTKPNVASVSFLTPPPKYKSPHQLGLDPTTKIFVPPTSSRAHATPSSFTKNKRTVQVSRSETQQESDDNKSRARGGEGIESIIEVLNKINKVLMQNIHRKTGTLTKEAFFARERILAEATADLEDARLESARCYNQVLDLKQRYDDHGELVKGTFEELRVTNLGLTNGISGVIESLGEQSVLKHLPEAFCSGTLPSNFLSCGSL